MNPNWSRLQDEADELRSLQISKEPVAWRDAVLDLHRRLEVLEAGPVDAPPAPTPAAEGDGELWRVMLEARRRSAGFWGQYPIHPLQMRGMAAEILALRDWLQRELGGGEGDPEPTSGTAGWYHWCARQNLLDRLTLEATIAQRAAEGRSDG